MILNNSIKFNVNDRLLAFMVQHVKIKLRLNQFLVLNMLTSVQVYLTIIPFFNDNTFTICFNPFGTETVNLQEFINNFMVKDWSV